MQDYNLFKLFLSAGLIMLLSFLATLCNNGGFFGGILICAGLFFLGLAMFMPLSNAISMIESKESRSQLPFFAGLTWKGILFGTIFYILGAAAGYMLLVTIYILTN